VSASETESETDTEDDSASELTDSDDDNTFRQKRKPSGKVIPECSMFPERSLNVR
jgi:hypothetical protein